MTDVNEEWRPVVGWEALYEVSSLGRVRSVARAVHVRGGGRAGAQYRKRVRERILKPGGHKNQYLYVSLMRDAQRKVRSIHSLVCEAFHGPCPIGFEAAHGDGDRTNNSKQNLRWALHIDNCRDKEDHGTLVRGDLSPVSILTTNEVISIKHLLKTHRVVDVWRMYPQVTYACIRQIFLGNNWKHI